MKQIIIAVIATTLTSGAWAAEQEQATKLERIGLGSGALIGAAAGGPLGFIIGAAAGVWMGDRFHQEQTARADYEEKWTDASEQVASLNGLVESSERRIVTLEARSRQDASAMRDAVSEAVDLHVLFKTDEVEVDSATQERLARLATRLTRMDGLSISVGGYADARGDAQHNAQLSAQRAANVRATLIRAGVPAERILVNAHGEQFAAAEDQGLDVLAFDRRVQLTLIPAETSERVARQ